MKTKRLLALLLVLCAAMALMLSVPAFAVDEEGDDAAPVDGAASFGTVLPALYAQAGSPDAEAADDQSGSEDYAKALGWALSEGLLTEEADAYPADRAVSREQLALVLYRFAEYSGKEVSQRRELSSYSDYDQISEEALDAVSWAHATGLLNRTGLHTIGPQDAAKQEAVDAAIAAIPGLKDVQSGVETTHKAGFFDKLKAEFEMNFIAQKRWTFLTKGLLNTLKITFVSTILGIVLGAVIAIIRSTWDKNQESMRPGLGKILLAVGNGICKVYLTVIRGTPVLVQLMIIYFIIFANASDGVPVAMLAFGMNSAAYVAEIIRSGIMSTDNGQFEAGRSLGFNYVQTMWYIIIPQALRAVLPALANEFIVLLKETSVAGYVGIRDLTKGGDLIRGVTFSAFMPLIAVALIYLILVMFFTWLVGKLERRLRNDER